MLDIVASYQCMQFQGKLMNQTWENGKKPSFEPNFGPNSGCQIFFSKIWLRQSLEIMASYHHVQYQKKLRIQSWENLWWTNRHLDRQTTEQREESDFKKWAVSVFKYSDYLPSCQKPEKSNEPFLRKILNWWMNRWTDGKTGNGDFLRPFIGRGSKMLNFKRYVYMCLLV